MKYVPFPSVTVCFPKSERWLAMIEALNHFDTNDNIFDLIRDQDEKIQAIFSRAITEPNEIIKNAFDFNLKWNPDLKEVLDLNPNEVELMFLLSYATFELKLTQTYYRVSHFAFEVIEKKFYLALNKTSKYESNQILKSFVCDYNGVSCPFINEEAWFNCDENIIQKYDANYKLWCNNASNFNPNYDDDIMIEVLLNTVTQLKMIDLHLTKRNLIEASFSALLDDSNRNSDMAQVVFGDSFEKFDHAFANYFQKICPLESSNGTLLDLWQILKPEKEEKITNFESLTNDTFRKSIYNCLENESASSCQKIETIEKELKESTELKAKIMKLFNQPELDSFLPLCNFGEDTLHLKPCNGFNKAVSTFKGEKCFTFNQHGNKKLIDLKLGPNGGLNLMINFDYPGNDKDRFQPAKIILHEPEVYPDLNHIKNDYFLLDPGQIVTLKAKPTKIDTTSDFKGMGFFKRQCKLQPSDEPKYNEMNCLMESIFNNSIADCGCKPLIHEKAANDCNFTGLNCFYRKFKNHTINHSKFEVCFTAYVGINN